MLMMLMLVMVIMLVLVMLVLVLVMLMLMTLLPKTKSQNSKKPLNIDDLVFKLREIMKHHVADNQQTRYGAYLHLCINYLLLFHIWFGL
jgi:flagellar basal body-associated protein FliL